MSNEEQNNVWRAVIDDLDMEDVSEQDVIAFVYDVGILQGSVFHVLALAADEYDHPNDIAKDFLDFAGERLQKLLDDFVEERESVLTIESEPMPPQVRATGGTVSIRSEDVADVDGARYRKATADELAAMFAHSHGTATEEQTAMVNEAQDDLRPGHDDAYLL